MIVPRTFDPAAELQRAFELLGKNIILVLPTAVSSLIVQLLIVTVITAAVGSAIAAGVIGNHEGSTGAAVTAIGLTSLIAIASIVGAVVVSILASAVVVHAAEAAWEGRPPDIGASFAAAMSKLPALIVASLLGALIMIIPFALAFVFIGIPLILIVSFFLMYTIPAVMIGNKSGTDAISQSFRLARNNVGPSAIAFLAIVVAAIVGGAVTATVGHVPILGWIAAFVVGGFTSAFVALVDARFYSLLRTE